MERHSITRQTINLRKVLGRGAWVLLALLLILGLAKAQPAYGQPAAPAATFTVNDMGDQADVTPDGNCAASNGKCTLRAAIMEANYVAGHDIINFNNSYLIMPGSVLPDLSDVDGVTITGAGYNVWINGTNINTMVGLNLVGDGNIIQGLVISHFYTGIQISNGSIENIIGTDGDGTGDETERNYIVMNNAVGILVASPSGGRVAGNYIGYYGGIAQPNQVGIQVTRSGNIIGTNGDGNGDAAEGNVISGNTYEGLRIVTIDATQNVVAGNIIGLDPTGSTAVPNGDVGINIRSAPENLIGTDGNGVSDDLERNIISGNVYSGIYINQENAANNVVAGNWIGLNASGDAAVPNGEHGVYISTYGTAGDMNDNIIGTNGDGNGDAAEGNIISGNVGYGIYISGATISQTVIAGNWIGLNAAGDAALPNGQSGIYIGEAPAVRIGTNGDGTSDALEGNVISGNTSTGILIGGDSSTGNKISGNVIGLNAQASAAVPNGDAGVSIATSGNVIGTDGDENGDAAERNIISGNAIMGIAILGGAGGNVVAGNWIGLDIAGTTAISNTMQGIYITQADNRIGTDGDGKSDELERNIVSGNGDDGIYINYSGASGNVVAGNWVGLDATGNAALPNGGRGVFIGAGSNTIGTNGDGNGDAAEGNVISGNGNTGLYIQGSNTSGVIVAGNLIGLNAAGTAAIANAGNGLSISEATETRIGTNGDGVSDDLERNIISGNTQNGISLSTRTSNSLVAGNIIGLNAAGDAAIPNGMWGVDISAADHNTIGTNGDGNGDTSESNLISGNGQGGIAILNDEAIGNLVTGNNIYANNGLGIDLRRNGVTPNDPGDTDIGANNQQNFPVLEAAVFQDGELTITGTLETSPTQQFTLELFASEACDASGYGEGQYYLGAITATTDISGSVDFVAGLAMADRPARFITATATDPEGNTSEFSACAGLQPFISVADTVVTEGDDGQVSAVFTVVLDYTSTLTVTVDYATADGTALAGVDYLSATGQLTFLAGEMTQTITVTVLGDTEIEADENFTIILSAPENAILANTQALGTIMDDDVDVIYVNYLPLIVR